MSYDNSSPVKFYCPSMSNIQDTFDQRGTMDLPPEKYLSSLNKTNKINTIKAWEQYQKSPPSGTSKENQIYELLTFIYFPGSVT